MHFSADEVVDAYLVGKKEGLNEYKRVLLEKLRANAEFIAYLVDGIARKASNSFGIEVIHSFLKIDSPIFFRVLLAVSEDDYLSDKILEVYGLLSEVEKEYGADTLNIDFSITDCSADFDIDLVYADGYLLRVKEEDE